MKLSVESPPYHLLLVDALNLIRRIYAIAERPFQPIRGELSDQTRHQLIHNTATSTASAIKKLLQQFSPSHALMVFDASNTSWRKTLFPEYKEGRSPMPEALAYGMGQIQDHLLDVGIDSLLPEEDEADDVIATLALKTAAKQIPVTIISTDKGFNQLLHHDHIHVYDYFHRKFIQNEDVIEKFGIHSHQFSDFLSLAGDATNNIPGVSGIGPKSALEILSICPKLDHLDLHRLPPKYKCKMEEEWDSWQVFRQISQLKTDIELGINLKQLRLQRD